MALPTQMLLCIVVTAMAIPSITGTIYSDDCSLDPESMIISPVFLANLKSVLDALPAAAAATGFAAQQFGLDPDTAFARGLCISDHPSPQQCLECLQSTVIDMTENLCEGALRAGYWGDDCFLAIADSNTSSPREEAFRRLYFSFSGFRRPMEKFYELQELVDVAQPLSLLPHNAITASGATANTTTRGTSTVRALARCAGDRTEGNCTQCLQDSVRYLSQCPGDGNGDGLCGMLDGTFAGVAKVLSYNCYLQLEISPPAATPPTGKGESLRLFFLLQLVGLVVYATTMM